MHGIDCPTQLHTKKGDRESSQREKVPRPLFFLFNWPFYTDAPAASRLVAQIVLLTALMLPRWRPFVNNPQPEMAVFSGKRAVLAVIAWRH